jgi:protoporphyrinogen/coproporphyrinogen III oxidase
MTIDVAILGGGISGLSLAFFLEEKYPSISITLFEPQERLGGWIDTIRLPSGQLYETGPRALRLRGKSAIATEKLVTALNLSQELIKASPLSNSRYVILDKKPQKLPCGFLDLFTTRIGRELTKCTLLEPFRKKGSADDESVASFFARRAPSPLVELLANALVSGIWGGHPEKLSINHTFPELKEFEMNAGSCLLGGIASCFRKKEKARLNGIYSFREGLTQFVTTLAHRLRAKIHLSTKVHSITRTEHSVILKTSQGDFSARKVVCALPEKDLLSLAPELLLEKGLFPHASFATAVMGWKADLLQNKGFGILAPSTEDPIVLGIVFDSSVFPEQNTHMNTRLTVIMGGVRAPDAIEKDDKELLSIAEERVRAWTGIQEKPDEYALLRARESIAEPPVGAFPPQPFIASSDKSIFAIGPSIGGVSMNQCICSAHELVGKESFL